MKDKKNKTGAFIDDEALRMDMGIFGDGSRIVPRIAVQQGKKYIPWKDNGNSVWIDYPIKLLEIYNNSSLHHSILDMKAEAIAGGGLKIKDENDSRAAATTEWLERLNHLGQDAKEVNIRLAKDFAIFSAFSPQIVYRDDWSFIDQIVHQEIAKLRKQAPDDEYISHGYFWAFDWSKYRPTRQIYMEGFNPATAEMKATEYKEIIERIIEENEDIDTAELDRFLSLGNTQLYYYMDYSPNNAYYPIPDYVGAIPTVETDIQSDIYAISSLKNGMDNGLSITMLGDSTDADDQKTARRLVKGYGGARNAGKPFIIFAEDFETAPKIEDVGSSNSLASKYKTINESVQQKILSGHRIPNSSMVGIQTAGKLGSTNESTDSEEIFFTKYIRPRQEKLESFWNKIMKYNNLAEVEIVNTNVFNENLVESDKANVIEKEEL